MVAGGIIALAVGVPVGLGLLAVLIWFLVKQYRKADARGSRDVHTK